MTPTPSAAHCAATCTMSGATRLPGLWGVCPMPGSRSRSSSKLALRARSSTCPSQMQRCVCVCKKVCLCSQGLQLYAPFINARVREKKRMGGCKRGREGRRDKRGEGKRDEKGGGKRDVEGQEVRGRKQCACFAANTHAHTCKSKHTHTSRNPYQCISSNLHTMSSIPCLQCHPKHTLAHASGQTCTHTHTHVCACTHTRAHRHTHSRRAPDGTLASSSLQ